MTPALQDKKVVDGLRVELGVKLCV
jgi:hypothetical protein